jgi:hypothetical protein
MCSAKRRRLAGTVSEVFAAFPELATLLPAPRKKQQLGFLKFPASRGAARA